MQSTSTAPDLAPVEELRRQLADIEEKVVTGYSLGDAIREGCGVTSQLTGSWINGTSNMACAQGAAWIALKARGYIT